MPNGAFPFIIPCDKINYSMEFYAPWGMLSCQGRDSGKESIYDDIN
ncbi:hypothetical protein CLOSCI_04056 [[Clostridium] scindens ATCC 35704]|nr:hypothetical protein CLOSCI_04056 [[Clostridium] scindens ATCC 35704]